MEDYLFRMHRETSSLFRVRTEFPAEFVIAIAIRPFPPNSKFLGAAFPHSTSSKSCRATIGGKFLNTVYVPSEPHSDMLLHFSHNDWNNWIDRRTS
jgi:hypothetical protein